MVARSRSSYARVSRSFFDKDRIKRGMDAATRTALSEWGAFVRSDARKSLRRAGKKTPASTPPAPPRSRTGKLKGGILFFYDARQKNVIIGPVRFARARADNLVMLEHGGRRTQLMPYFSSRERFHSGKRIKRRVRDARGRYMKQRPDDQQPREKRTLPMVVRMAVYPARPFMEPAKQKNLPKAARCFKDKLV